MSHWQAGPPAEGGPGSRSVDLDLAGCLACGQVCEITGSFRLPGPCGAEEYVRTRCVAGHVLMGPEFALRSG